MVLTILLYVFVVSCMFFEVWLLIDDVCHVDIKLWIKETKRLLKQLFCRHSLCWYSNCDPSLKTCNYCGKELINKNYRDYDY